MSQVVWREKTFKQKILSLKYCGGVVIALTGARASTSCHSTLPSEVKSRYLAFFRILIYMVDG